MQRVRLGMQPCLLALPCIRCLQQREVSACEPKKRKSSFAYRGVVSNSAIIRLSPLSVSSPPLSCRSIHILITAFPSPALRHSIRALPASGFALLLPPPPSSFVAVPSSQRHTKRKNKAKEGAKKQQKL
ncbi:hypothetical protein ILYODFUR_010670 [Ilyodon furcidens]|uniref:Uncharacterized protein n=1 Tax=Ilyodon furcidens TaxID=33524 RepID=A0ABV0V2T0_9TELE